MLRYLSSRNVYQTVPIYNLNWVRPKKLFRELLGDSIITLVDVGARAESTLSVEELTPLENHINYIGFDADEEEVERLKSLPSKYFASQYISSFVSNRKETVTFKLHYDAGSSSVYDMSESYTRWFRKSLVEKELLLQADSLDNLLTQDIDFIKLDTQGNEFEILSGAERCLSTALMVEVEVEFFPVYESQKLAHDVISKMYNLGYELLYLNRVFGSSEAFKGISRGQMIFGDALFGLSRDKVLEYSLEKQKKYCVLLINYGHIDFAFDIYNANPNLQQYCGSLGRFFDHLNKNPSKVSRVIKFLVDKIVFILLHIRKTNGLHFDSDRSWPTR
jgi:FkbM family methyltransferase